MNGKFAAFLTVGGIALTAASLRAQEPGRFQVTPAFGVMRFDRTSALSSQASGVSTRMWAYGSLSALYRIRSGLRAGLYVEGGRATADAFYYPLVLLRYNQTYKLDSLSQRVVVLSYGLAATYDIPLSGK